MGLPCEAKVWCCSSADFFPLIFPSPQHEFDPLLYEPQLQYEYTVFLLISLQHLVAKKPMEELEARDPSICVKRWARPEGISGSGTTRNKYNMKLAKHRGFGGSDSGPGQQSTCAVTGYNPQGLGWINLGTRTRTYMYVANRANRRPSQPHLDRRIYVLIFIFFVFNARLEVLRPEPAPTLGLQYDSS